MLYIISDIYYNQIFKVKTIMSNTEIFKNEYRNINPAVEIIFNEKLINRKRSFKKSDASLNQILMINNSNSNSNLKTDPPKELLNYQKDIIEKIVNPKRTYRSVKYNGNIYYLGDFLVVTDIEDYSICKLTKILPFNLSHKESPGYWPSIEVEWYYRKKDIIKEKLGQSVLKRLSCISEYEIFKTDHRDIIFIESIISKCIVLSFEEYDSLMNPQEENTYFTRASFDTYKKRITPPIEKWSTSCYCQMPLNPDQLYIKCDSCDGWYHQECSGIEEENIEKVDFICKTCKKVK